MHKFVLDSSVAISWFMPDENSSLHILEKLSHDGAIVPSIWLLEISNVLLCAERAKRITLQQRQQALYYLKELPIKIDQPTIDRVWFHTLDIATEQGLTIYDASYIEIAIRYELPLATLDKALKRAAIALQIEIIV